MTLDNILDEMESIILEASRIPLTDKIIIEESDLSLVMDKLREAVPKEVKRAHDLLESQNNIIADSRTEADNIVEQARAEADRIIALAKAEAERLVRAEKVVQDAEAKANNILENTQQYDRDMRAAADAYADKLHVDAQEYANDVFAFLEDSLQKTLLVVRENSKSLQEAAPDERNKEIE